MPAGAPTPFLLHVTYIATLRVGHC